MPFRTDPNKIMQKVLNLMTIINEVDDLTNVADLKNKIEMQKNQIFKIKLERDDQVNKLLNQKTLIENECQVFKS